MPLKEAEAIVLRTYPMREADLLVTLFTRREGKVRGVARSAMKSRKRFGGALEPLTLVRAYYEDREGRELARLDSCDVIRSPLAAEVTYPRAVALAHVAELLDDLMPDREANDAVFRLAVATLGHLEGDAIWMPLTYFDLWLTRLVGFMPELAECVKCGARFGGNNGPGAEAGRKAYFHALADGLRCGEHKRVASSELTPESRRIAAEMFRSPLPKFAGISWPKAVAADLRKLLVQTLERHLDKNLNTAAMLDKLPG